MRDAAAVTAAVETAVRAFGRIDVLFNNDGDRGALGRQSAPRAVGPARGRGGAVLYLVSDDGRYVTGAQFVIDAGLLSP